MLVMGPKDNFLTILMPVFNGKKYIRDAIESILNQKYSDQIILLSQINMEFKAD